MAYNTGNAPGSTDPRDLSDSSGDIDEWATSKTKLTHPDRLGVQRKTWHGIEQQVNDLIIAGGQIFPDEPTGRAAVGDGQYFYAESTNPDVSKTIYKRLSASVSELIADEPSIGIFDEVLRQRGNAPANSSASDLLTPGTYLLLPNNGYTEMPDEYDPAVLYFLYVSAPGDANGKNNSRYGMQTLIEFLPSVGDQRLMWERRFDRNNPGLGSVNKWSAARTHELELTKQRGVLPAAASVTDILSPGTYLLLPNNGYTEMPDEYDPALSYFLNVHAPGDANGNGITRYGLQTLIEFAPSSSGRRREWERRFDNQNPGLGADNGWIENRRYVDVDEAFKQRGVLPAAASATDALSRGTYLLLPNQGYTEMPNDYDPSVSYFLSTDAPGDVNGNGNSRYGLQTLIEFLPSNVSGVRRQWERRFDRNNPGLGSANNWSEVRASEQAPNWSKRTIVAFGDSITQGRLGFEWPPRLQQFTSANVVNGGFGGTRMAVHEGGESSVIYDPFSMYRISERVAADAAGDTANGWQVLIDAAITKDTELGGVEFEPIARAIANQDWGTVDYVVIAFGTNDFKGNVSLGTDTDMTGETFKGAINLTVANICASRPNIKIVFATPMWRARVNVDGDDSNITPNGGGVFLQEYVNAVIERAAAHQIPVIDMYSECGINIHNWERYIPDGLHIDSEQGVDLFARKIYGGLKRYYG
ncbi:hypothetical protein HHSLTHF2_06930 [Vreelandella venusta]|uniref:SGNH hydrolase-type esterase domain-containing protein n=1 Tax=Halomonas hydrothermalis TaxID=115561 RepID=A0A6F8U1J4_9GAMM|nr:GDSL-type esterase/lipase family protein [Halomonas hydrothermalis]BCB06803.1 hypothetical protein HHSLTHF2_06930 [Halomonas hydrothermalis]